MRQGSKTTSARNTAGGNTLSGTATGGRKTGSQGSSSILSAEMGAELKKLFRSNGPQPDEAAVLIERELIEPNPAQPRQRFQTKTLQELGDSLRQNGQLQECVVRPHPTATGRYQLIAGERRWRAAASEYGNISHLRCVVRDVDDAEALVLALEENARREDISPVERARTIDNLRNVSPGKPNGKPLTMEEIGTRIGLSKVAVHRLLELLKLPEDTVRKFQELNLNEKHGRGLLLLKDVPISQANLLQAIEREDLSGNQTLKRAEEMLQQALQQETPGDSSNLDQRGSRGLTQNPSIGHQSSPQPAGNPMQSTQGNNSKKSDKKSDTSSINPLGNGESSRGELSLGEPSQTDPLLSSLKPAVAHLVESKRVLGTLKVTATYRRRVLQELDLAQKQIDELRTLVE